MMHRLALRTWRVCCLLALLGCSAGGLPLSGALAADDANVVGFVLSIKGDWTLEGNPPRAIQGGDRLPPLGQIRPDRKDSGATLVVCLYNGEATSYSAAAKLPARKSDSLVDRLRSSIWSAVSGRYRGSVVQAASRGSELLGDTVLQTDGKQVDVAGALTDLPEGNWTLRLTKAPPVPDDKGEPAAKPVTFSVKWAAGKPAICKGESLAPGLYELQVINVSRERPVGEAAVVLLCDKASHSDSLKEFEAAVALTETWDEKIRDDSAIPFLRALMLDLADRQQAAQR